MQDKIIRAKILQTCIVGLFLFRICLRDKRSEKLDNFIPTDVVRGGWLVKSVPDDPGYCSGQVYDMMGNLPEYGLYWVVINGCGVYILT